MAALPQAQGPSVWDGVFLEQSGTQPKLVVPESSGQDAAALAQDPNSSVWDGVFLDQSGTQPKPIGIEDFQDEPSYIPGQ